MNRWRVTAFAVVRGQVVEIDVVAEVERASGALTFKGPPPATTARIIPIVRAALSAMGLSVPTVGARCLIACADWPEPAQLALPAAIGMLGAVLLLPAAPIGRFAVFGRLAPDGAIGPADGVAQAARRAAAGGLGFICETSQAAAGADAGCVDVLPVPDLMTLLNDLRGIQRQPRPWQAPPAIGGVMSEAPAASLKPPTPHGPPTAHGRWEAKPRSWLPRLFDTGRRPQPAGAAAAPPPMLEAEPAPMSKAEPAPMSEAEPAPMSEAEQAAAMPDATEAQAAAEPSFATTGPAGHRGRLREKVLERGTDALADYELLEMLLFFAFKTGDTKPLAKRLINRYGSFARVLCASPQDLLATPGLGPHSTVALQLVRAAAVRLARAEVQEQPVLGNEEKLSAYLNMILARERVEQFRVLFLDARNRLIADEVQGRGTVNHVPAYPREIVRRALELHASAMILVHNHPSGDPTPSLDDIEMTRDIQQAAQPLAIRVFDHVIVGNGKSTSLRREGFIR